MLLDPEGYRELAELDLGALAQESEVLVFYNLSLVLLHASSKLPCIVCDGSNILIVL